MFHPSVSCTALVWFLVAAPPASAQAATPTKSLFPDQPTALDVSKTLIFEEPLIPLGQSSPRENQVLAKALDAYVAGGALENLDPVKGFLDKHSKSPWRLSLLVNLGLMYRHTGQVTPALDAWEAAWTLGKTSRDPKGIAFAHRALGELLEANAGLGRADRLEALVKEAEGRSLSGPISEKLSMAKESLTYKKLSPETAFRCGPTALSYLKATDSPQAFADLRIHNMLSTEKGTSLAMNQAWASQIGLKLQMAKRNPGADIPVPSVLHFRTGHFAAAMFVKGDKVLVQDPFLGDTWLSVSVIDREASGYGLIPEGTLPKGWKAVAKPEGETVWGKGAWGPGRPDDTRPDSYRIPMSLAQVQPGMPTCAIQPNLVSLHLDIPASSYTPARGPRTDVAVTYNQREYGQPQIFDYCNLGPKWTFSYMTCLKDDSTNPDFNVTLCNPGGGGLVFQSRGDGTYQPEGYTQAQLVRLPGNTYIIKYLDGQKDFYEMADRAWGVRRVVITRRQDASGNEVKFTWDAMLRLVAITDASGRVTTLSYEFPEDPLKLTKVTDPNGRSTSFWFNDQGRLIKTINPQGIATTFTYGPTAGDPAMSGDFINGMTTPVGTIAFREGETLVGPNYRRWLEARVASGKMERVESGAGYAYEIDPEQLPNVPELDPAYHHLAFRFRESFFWKPDTFEASKPNYRKAKHIRWGHGPGAFSSGIVLSEKEPDGPRHWFVHAGDFWGGVFPGARGAQHPMTADDVLKPGFQIVGVKGTPAMVGSLAPVYDGCRKLVTRDYWVNPDGSIGSILRDFDPQGHLIQESSYQ